MDKEFTIDELAAESGIPSRTIRFYAQEKLVPPPDGFKGRTALYSEKHLELLKLIRNLKEKKFMPLSVIREVIEDPEKLAALHYGLEVNEEIFNLLGYQPPTLNFDDILKRADLSAVELEQLESFSFVHPSVTEGEKQFSEADLAIAKLVKNLNQLGLEISEMRVLPEILTQLARTAVGIIHNKFHDDLTMSPEQCLTKLETIISINKELTMLVFQQLIQEAAKDHILSDLQNSCCHDGILREGE